MTQLHDREVERAARFLGLQLGPRVHAQRRAGATERQLRDELFQRLVESVWETALNTADDLDAQATPAPRRRVAEHLQGQHDQKDHGRRGDGGAGNADKGAKRPASRPSGTPSPAVPAAQTDSPEAALKTLFKPAELDLPDAAYNRAKTKEAVYADAKRLQPTYEKALDHGEGVDRAIKARVVRPDSPETFMAALRGPGPVVIIAPLKGEKRAQEKVDSKFKGDWSQLHDVIRATVAVDSLPQLTQAMEAIRSEMEENGWVMAEKPDDRISNPLPSGYRDVQMKFTREGHVAELQLNLKSMIIAKEGEGHKLYEEQRSLIAQVQKEKRDFTPQELAIKERLDKQMSAIYHKAWAAAA